MVVLFLLLAVITGVVIGEAAVANTGAGSLRLLDWAFTGFTQGQLLVMAAGAGFICAWLLVLARRSSKRRRIRRTRRRALQSDLEAPAGEPERGNAEPRDEVDAERPTSAGPHGDMVANGTGDMTPLPRRTVGRGTNRLTQRIPPARRAVTSAHDLFDPADK
jgi:uncharacterized integral membrane protein